MKTLITLFALVAVGAVVTILAHSPLRIARTESTLAAVEMEQVYGADWAERLLAAGTTNRSLYLEMLTAYYQAVDINAEGDSQPANWVGYRFLRGRQPDLARSPH